MSVVMSDAEVDALYRELTAPDDDGMVEETDEVVDSQKSFLFPQVLRTDSTNCLTISKE